MTSKIGVSLWLEPSPTSVINTSLQSTISSLMPLFDDSSSFKPHLTITSQIDIDPKSQEQIDAVLNAAKTAAASVDSIDVVFNNIVYGSKFTKKVYLTADRTAKLLSLAQICREEFVLLPTLLRNKRKRSSSSIADASDSTAPPAAAAPAATAEQANLPSRKNSAKKRSSTPPAIAPPEVLSPPIAPSSPEYQDALQQATKEAAEWLLAEFDPHVSLVYSNTYPVEEALQQTINSRLMDLFGETFLKKKIGFRGTRLSLVLCEGPVDGWKVLGHRDF